MNFILWCSKQWAKLKMCHISTGSISHLYTCFYANKNAIRVRSGPSANALWYSWLLSKSPSKHLFPWENSNNLYEWSYRKDQKSVSVLEKGFRACDLWINGGHWWHINTGKWKMVWKWKLPCRITVKIESWLHFSKRWEPVPGLAVKKEENTPLEKCGKEVPQIYIVRQQKKKDKKKRKDCKWDSSDRDNTVKLGKVCTESREQQRMRMLLQNPALWNNRKEKTVAGFVYNKLTRKKDVPTAALRSSRNSETFHWQLSTIK